MRKKSKVPWNMTDGRTMRPRPKEESFSRSRRHTCMLWIAAAIAWTGNNDRTTSVAISVLGIIYCGSAAVNHMR